MSRPNDSDVAGERPERERAPRDGEGLVAAVTEILFVADPIGLADGPPDEYRPEARLILLAMEAAPVDSASAVRLVHETFVHMFGSEIAGPLERYAEPAARIRALVRGRLERPL